MNKKIIAVFCVVILMASLFTACGKKLYTQEINGKEQPVVTNENGELVTGVEGDVAIYVTDSKGEKVTDSEGNPNINYIKPSGAIINPNNTMICENFKLNIPDGWFGDSNGSIYKDGTDSKCYIKAMYEATANAENTFASYVDAILVQNRTIMDNINNGSEETKQAGYAKAEYTSDEFSFQNYEGYKLSYTIYDANGKVVHYAENLYFVIDDGTIYSMNYACEEGTGYDSSFNFSDWATKNITFTGPTVKE